MTDMTDTLHARRRLFAAALALPWLAGCDTPASIRPVPLTPPRPERPPPQAVAPGVWLLPGEADEARGRSANAVLLAGDRAALLVNAGGSRRDGEALLASVRQLTDRPLRGLLLTHASPDLVFGGSACQAAGVPVWMHRDAARVLAERGEAWLAARRDRLGEAELAGTRLIVPDHLFDARDADASLAPLPDIGRPLRLIAPIVGERAASPGDSSLWDPRSASLVSGARLDLASEALLPEADLRGWRRALDQVALLGAHNALPVHGPADDAARLIGQMRRRLDRFEAGPN
jgi:glyoxylase-like metal-dependent hydrolase (beta-lactamase superfamily II)